MVIPRAALRKPRTPFRSGLDGPPAPLAAPEPGFDFAPAAERPAGDRDVLFGYQIFLGRNPENSFVISEAKASRVREFLRGMLRSPELLEAVARPLANGRPLPHGRVGAAPSEAQKAWVAEIMALPEAAEAELADAGTWRALWRVLADHREFPRDLTGGGAAPSPEAAPEAEAAEHGFVLISVDQPKPGERLHPGAVLSGSGWAIAPDDIAEVSVHLDGRLLAHARHGLPRPDVARNFPHYRHVECCGFAFSAALPADLALSATSELVIAVRTVSGESARRSLAVLPAEAVSPAEQETWPVRLAVEEARARGGQVRLRGWAISREALARVRVFAGAAALGEAEHGLARPDIGDLYPSYPNAARSGFVFAGALPEDAGEIVSLRVQAEDAAGRQRQVIVPVAAGAAAPEGPDAAGMRLELDRPAVEDGRAIDPVRGACTIAGWAVAPAGIASVEVFSDGNSLGTAYLGIRREDIARAFPDHKGSLLAGWALVLPPGAVPPGERDIRVLARAEGGATLEQNFAWRVEDADAALPGGAIRTHLSRAEAAFGLRLLRRLGAAPPVTVLLRAENDPASAARSFASLAGQVYPSWRAVVLSPARAEPALREAAARAGISPQVTFARARATSPEPDPEGLVLLLRAGDELGSDALLEMAIAHGQAPQAGLVYADDVRRDPASGRTLPFFKPDWSPELLRGTNYIGRAWSARAALLARAGVTAEALAAGSDYAAVLRLSALAAPAHIGKVLLATGPHADDAAQEQAALGGASPLAVPGLWRQRRAVPHPRVSVVIPTCGAGDHVRTALPSLRATAGGHKLEIIVLDNVPAGGRRLKTWLRREADQVIAAPDAFNWSRFNNRGAAAATGDVLLFLNDDIEAREPGWLDAILEQIARPEVGVVGAKLLYPDGKVQHAGQFLAEGHARHAFRFARADDPGPFGLALVPREVSSVTGACLAVRRDVFAQLGGFDEAHSVVNNDLDFCLRAGQAGLSVIVTPHARLVHHELASRAGLADAYDETRFAGAWRLRFLRGDPYHPPRLSLDSDHWTPEPEPVAEIHAGPEGPDAAAVRRILAVKLDHIGDYLTAVPAIRSLKRRFPDAELTLLAPPATAALARGEAAIDDVIEFTFFHARSGRGELGVAEGEFEALAMALAPRRFDMAIDLRMQPETRKVLRYTGAPFLVGYDRDGRFPWLTVALEWEGDTRLLPKRQHVSERLLQLVAAADAACERREAPAQRARLAAAEVPALAALPEAFLARPIVCVHPGVGNVVRQWPAEYFAELIDMLTAEAGLHAVLVGGADEAPIAEAVMREVAAKERVVSLVGRLKLTETAQVMRAAALFVGNNSGPKHLAASLGVPTLGIHSAVVDATEWGPLGPAAFAIRRQMVCAPCYLEFASDCPRRMACLQGLRPRDAFLACLRLLMLT